MGQRVELGLKSLDDYRGLVGDEAVTGIEERAASFRDARVLHLNATAYGGGVAEILRTLVPLLRGLGIDAEWHVLSGNDAFFQLTKSLHNALQGMPTEFPPSLRQVYLSTLHANLDIFASDWDYVVVHDPQPAGLTGILDGRRTGHWIWRCHIDTSTPAEDAIDFLAPYTASYEVGVFTMPGYVSSSLGLPRVEFVPPSIDPLIPKNQALPRTLARQVLKQRFGIAPDRPLITQVSRFDPWKDPLGVIDAYRRVKQEVPDVQLALVGNMANDDPEGRTYHAHTVAHAENDPDIHILSTLDRLSTDELTHALEINAFQSGSEVVVQKSTREGFGLVVTEAMWKRAPVVGGRVGGIVEQIEDGVTGYLVSDTDECAERVVGLLEDERARRSMGAAARESVRRRFLTPRHLSDYLEIFESLA